MIEEQEDDSWKRNANHLLTEVNVVDSINDEVLEGNLNQYLFLEAFVSVM